MGRILPRPSGTAPAHLTCAAAAAALAMVARLLHGQRAPPTMRGLAKSTTRRRERRGTHFGVSPPQAWTETAAYRGFGGGNARKPRVAPASSNVAAARLWRSAHGGERREDSGQRR
jgi:hypothetical protein